MNIYQIINESFYKKYLNEDIESVKRQFSYIPEEDFFRIIKLDPTLDESKDSVGKYGKWLLSLYKKDNPLNYSEDEISKILDSYDKLKNDRKYEIEKDINKFKSFNDLQDAIEDVSEIELSDRQKERELRTSKDYREVYRDNDFTIYIPTTYAGSCTLGKGTRWCTAYSNDSSYFDAYTSRGTLYILISNRNPNEKYQFHFESDSFMNKDDREISDESFFEEYPKIRQFFIEEGKLYDPSKPYIYDGTAKIPGKIKEEIKEVIVIPGVTFIGEWAFRDCHSLKSITIPDSVTTIDNYALCNCISLKSITIPDSVTTIGDAVFLNCTSLTSVNIPNSVTSIGKETFSNCESLTSITIPDSVTIIDTAAFFNCTSLTSVTIPNSVTKIGSYAFSGCESLTSITIPNSVTKIDDGAFYFCDNIEALYTQKGSYAEEYFRHITYFPDVSIEYIN